MQIPAPYDVLIIGSGASGLGLALRLGEACRVAVIAKRGLQEGNTYYAQGGISAVLDVRDSIQSHVEDTLEAGAGLCDPEIVRMVVTEGKENVDWLLEQGVEFTRDADSPAGKVTTSPGKAVIPTGAWSTPATPRDAPWKPDWWTRSRVGQTWTSSITTLPSI